MGALTPTWNSGASSPKRTLSPITKKFDTAKNNIKKLTKNQLRKATKAKRKDLFFKRLITNLSDYPLSFKEFQTLTKGLKFIPKTRIKAEEISLAIKRLIRKMSLSFHFKNSEYKPPRLHKPTYWEPLTPKNSSLNTFFFRVKRDIQHLEMPQLGRDHLSDEESRIVEFFSGNPLLTIKPADKGGSLVIMNTQDYLDKANTQLNDSKNYKKLHHNSTLAIAHDISGLIHYLLIKGRITKETARFLEPKYPPRTPVFYGLPKIHKADCPL